MERYAIQRRLDELSAVGDHEGVLLLASRHLHELRGAASEAALRLRMGRACSRLGRLDEALPHLALARDHYECSSDPAVKLECLDEEATALYLREDRRALAVAQRAVQLCDARREEIPTSARCEALAHLGRICVSHHDWARGVRLLLEALDAQGTVRDVSQMARIFNDLSVALLGLGRVRRAVAYARRSLASCRMIREQRLLAQAQNNLGLALLQAGEHEEASARLRASLDICVSEGLLVGRSHVLLSLMELHIALRNPVPADEYATEAAHLSERHGELMTLATALLGRGRLAEDAGHRGLATRHFEGAIDLLASMHAGCRLVEAHTAYGDVLEARGDAQRAMGHYRQAVLVSRSRRLTSAG